MLHRAKNVISKKVEKVMGRKAAKSDISHADALKTALQNWVEEEEIKSVQVIEYLYSSGRVTRLCELSPIKRYFPKLSSGGKKANK
jgi:hypothetical protein